MDNMEMEKNELNPEELDQISGGFRDEDLSPEDLDQLNRYRAAAARLEAEKQAVLAKGHMPNPFVSKDFYKSYGDFCKHLRQKYGHS